MNNSSRGVTKELDRNRRRPKRNQRVTTYHRRDNWTARYVAFAAVMLIAMWLFDWCRPYDLALATIVCLAAWLISVAPGGLGASRRKGRSHETRGTATVRGTSSGIVAMAVLAAAIWVSRGLPSYDRFLDRDRETVESQIDVLSSHQDYLRAAAVIARRLSEPLSEQWRHELQHDHVKQLTLSGEHSGSHESAVPLLEEAVKIAQEYGVDPSVPQSLLEREQELAAAERRQADTALAEVASFDASLRSLSAGGEYAAADRIIRSRLTVVAASQWRVDPYEMLYDNLIDWGDSLGSPNEQIVKYQAALDLATSRKLDSRLAAARLAFAKANQPQILPSGVSGKVKRISNDASSTLFEVSIVREKIHYGGLRKQDFQLTVEGTSTDGDVLEVDRHDAHSVSVLFVVDQSESTTELRQVMHDGIGELVSASPEAVKFRAMCFAESATFVSPWTRDAELIVSGLRNSPPGRKTSLWTSVLAGVDELRGRAGKRLLVVLSDGGDTSGTDVTASHVSAACRDANVPVVAIGLENKSSRLPPLRQLAKDSSGLYISAAQHPDLVYKFQRIRTQISERVYWMRVHEALSVGSAFELRVGSGANAFVLTGRVPDSRQFVSTAHSR